MLMSLVLFVNISCKSKCMKYMKDVISRFFARHLFQFCSLDSINLFQPNGLAYPYQYDEPIANFRGVGWYFSKYLIDYYVTK